MIFFPEFIHDSEQFLHGFLKSNFENIIRGFLSSRIASGISLRISKEISRVDRTHPGIPLWVFQNILIEFYFHKFFVQAILGKFTKKFLVEYLQETIETSSRILSTIPSGVLSGIFSKIPWRFSACNSWKITVEISLGISLDMISTSHLGISTGIAEGNALESSSYILSENTLESFLINTVLQNFFSTDVVDRWEINKQKHDYSLLLSLDLTPTQAPTS